MAHEAVPHAISVTLIALGCTVTLLNLYGVIDALVRKKSFSSIPLLGGPMVAIGYALWPNQATRTIALVAILVDPGSPPAFVLFLLYRIYRGSPPGVNKRPRKSATPVDERQAPPDEPDA